VRIKKVVLGMKVYGSRHPISKRTGDIGVAKIRKWIKTRECTSLEGREIKPRT
jgi:hypothetical protein